MTVRKIILLIAFLSCPVLAQYNLNYFINKAVNSSPVVKDYANQYLINNLQSKLDEAQNSALQVYLTSSVMLSPYFNNNGVLFTPNPGPNAVGYDPSLTNGGLYSAQINFDKNIFNGGLLDALNLQRGIQGRSFENKSAEEKHNIEKQVTDQYLNTLQYYLLYDLSKNTEKDLSSQLKITGGLVEKGFAKASDYLQLKIELKTQSIDMQQTWQNYKSGLMQLYAMCGISDTQIVALDTVDLNMAGSNQSSNFLIQLHLDSLNAAAQQNIFETKYQPQVSLFFNAGLNAVEIDQMQRRFGMSAGINFSLPILDGGQKNITRQQSYISEQSLSDYKSFLAGNILTQRKNSEGRIASLKENLRGLDDQLSDYKKLIDLSESQLQGGNLSMLEYLTLLRNYIDLQKNKITTEINYQLEISNYNYWNW